MSRGLGDVYKRQERHGLNNMSAEVWDATVFDADSAGKADILICDLPCSGLGVLGRKKDIRYKMTPESVDELAALQRQILDTVHTYVKPNGVLVYSTCTIDEAENEDNVSHICYFKLYEYRRQRYSDFRLRHGC